MQINNMDKLLVNKYGECQLFNTVNNALKELPDSIDCRYCMLAENDGEAISATEVVPYKKNDFIIVLASYGKVNRTKIVVSSDPFAIDDFREWIKQLKADEAI